MKKIIRITTIPQSLRGLLKGQLRFMSNHYEVIGISSSGDALIDVAQNEGVSTYAVEMTRTISPFKDIKSVIRLYKIFRREKPFIVHTHTPKAGTVGMFAAWLARVPFRLHTVAGLPLVEARGKKRSLLNFVEKMTYAFATKVYPNSRGLNDIILGHKFCSPNKLKVIANGSSNGISTSHFDPSLYSAESRRELRISLGIDDDDFVFIFIGRLVKDKGINELIGVFDKISKERTNCKLLLVGRQEEKLDPLSPETLDAMEKNKNIILAGFQPDVRPFFSISDLLTFPSYREGFPNVVMQAGAMGLPAIVTDINGCNEIIENGENGYVIPVKNKESLEDKMIFLLQNREDLSSMAKKARAMIVSRYEQKMVWDSLLNEYESLAKK